MLGIFYFDTYKSYVSTDGTVDAYEDHDLSLMPPCAPNKVGTSTSKIEDLYPLLLMFGFFLLAPFHNRTSH